MNIFVYCSFDYDLRDRLLKRFHSEGINTDIEGNKGNYDMVCALGGDGTILDAGDIALSLDIPLFGINTGRVGFLAAFEKDIIDTITKKDIEGLYLSERCVLKNSITKDTDYAINEVGIFKENPGKTIELELFCDEISLGEYRCDGLLVSTATGSTAYNLSAGGPAMYPEVMCCVVTPICAYNSSARSIVLPIDKKISLRMSKREENALVFSDGKQLGVLKPNEEIEIFKAERKLKLLLSKERDIYGLISGTCGK